MDLYTNMRFVEAVRRYRRKILLCRFLVSIIVFACLLPSLGFALYGDPKIIAAFGWQIALWTCRLVTLLIQGSMVVNTTTTVVLLLSCLTCTYVYYVIRRRTLPHIPLIVPPMGTFDNYVMQNRVFLPFSNIDAIAARATADHLIVRPGHGISLHPNVRYDTMIALRSCLSRAVAGTNRDKIARGFKIGGVALSPQNVYRILNTNNMLQYFHFIRPILDSDDTFRVNDLISCRCTAQTCTCTRFTTLIADHCSYYMRPRDILNSLRNADEMAIVRHRFSGYRGTFYNEAEWVREKDRVIMHAHGNSSLYYHDAGDWMYRSNCMYFPLQNTTLSWTLSEKHGCVDVWRFKLNPGYSHPAPVADYFELSPLPAYRSAAIYGDTIWCRDRSNNIHSIPLAAVQKAAMMIGVKDRTESNIQTASRVCRQETMTLWPNAPDSGLAAATIGAYIATVLGADLVMDTAHAFRESTPLYQKMSLKGALSNIGGSRGKRFYHSKIFLVIVFVLASIGSVYMSFSQPNNWLSTALGGGPVATVAGFAIESVLDVHPITAVVNVVMDMYYGRLFGGLHIIYHWLGPVKGTIFHALWNINAYLLPRLIENCRVNHDQFTPELAAQGITPRGFAFLEYNDTCMRGEPIPDVHHSATLRPRVPLTDPCVGRPTVRLMLCASSTCIPVCSRKCHHNETLAVTSRALLNRTDGDSAQRLLRWNEFIRLTFDATFDAIKAELSIPRFSEWFSRFSATKREPLIPAREDQPKVVKKIDAFIKRELVLKGEPAINMTTTFGKNLTQGVDYTVKSYQPRVISSRTATYQAITGPAMYAMSKAIGYVHSYFHNLTYACGMNAGTLGCWWDKIMANASTSTVVFEADFSRFDAHVDEPALMSQYEFQGRLGIPTLVTQTQRGCDIDSLGYFPSGLRYTINATRKSGNSDTSIGNSILSMSFYTGCYMELFGTLDGFYLIVMGDDGLMSVPHDRFPAFKRQVAVRSQELGHVVTSEVHSYPFARASFCSGRFYPLPLGGYRFAGKIARSFAKNGYRLTYKSPLDDLDWCRSYVYNYTNEYAHVPVAAHIVLKIAQLLGYGYAGMDDMVSDVTDMDVDVFRQTHHSYNKIHVYQYPIYQPGEVHQYPMESWVHLAEVYDIMPSDLIDFVDFVEAQTDLPLDLEHPVFVRMLAVDL